MVKFLHYRKFNDVSPPRGRERFRSGCQAAIILLVTQTDALAKAHDVLEGNWGLLMGLNPRRSKDLAQYNLANLPCYLDSADSSIVIDTWLDFLVDLGFIKVEDKAKITNARVTIPSEHLTTLEGSSVTMPQDLRVLLVKPGKWQEGTRTGAELIEDLKEAYTQYDEAKKRRSRQVNILHSDPYFKDRAKAMFYLLAKQAATLDPIKPAEVPDDFDDPEDFKDLEDPEFPEVPPAPSPAQPENKERKQAIDYLVRQMKQLTEARRDQHASLTGFCPCRVMLFADPCFVSDRKVVWVDFLFELGAIDADEQTLLRNTKAPSDEYQAAMDELRRQTVSVPTEIQAYLQSTQWQLDESAGAIADSFRDDFQGFLSVSNPSIRNDEDIKAKAMAKFVMLSKAAVKLFTVHSDQTGK